MYQLIIERDNTSSIWFAGVQRAGSTVWVRSEQSARELIASGVCRWPPAGPSASMAHGGPTEKK